MDVHPSLACLYRIGQLNVVHPIAQRRLNCFMQGLTEALCTHKRERSQKHVSSPSASAWGNTKTKHTVLDKVIQPGAFSFSARWQPSYNGRGEH